MACYPCTHCNKCGMYSAMGISVCAACETPMPPGTPVCPNCGGRKTKTMSIAPEGAATAAKVPR